MFQALIVVVFLGWLFVPIYIKAGVNTLPNTPLLYTHPLPLFLRNSDTDLPIKVNVLHIGCV